MNYPKIAGYAITHALGAALYIWLVAMFISTVGNIVGQQDDHLGATLFLTTLVVSVATMGTLIFARPTLWFLDGKKQEAVALLIATIFSLALVGVLIFVLIATIMPPVVPVD